MNSYRLVSLFIDLFRPRAAFLVENVALRQQPAVVAARKPSIRIKPAERLLWILLARPFSRWREILLIVRPETVIGRHRQGCRAYWRWNSRERPGRPFLETTSRIRILVVR